jgi:hypothetical protein
MIDKGAGFLQKPYGQRNIGLKIREILDRELAALGESNPIESNRKG